MNLDTLLLHLAQFAPDRARENALLLCCLPGDRQRQLWATQLADPGLDWTYVLNQANDHGLMPLLYRQLVSLTHANHFVSTLVKTKLEKDFTDRTYFNLGVTLELLKLLRLFQAEGIPVLTFKGPVLAQFIHANLSLRQFIDLDLLVHQAQLPQAIDLLTTEGYIPGVVDLTPAQQAYYTRYFHEFTFVHPEKGVQIDLHWELIRQHFSFSPPPELAWENSISVKIGGQNVSTLSRELLVLYLCTHAAKENWSSLNTLYDLTCVINPPAGVNENGALHWDWITTHAGQLGTKRMLHLGLYLAHELLGTEVPASILAEIQQDQASCGQSESIIALALEVQRQLFAPPAAELATFSASHLFIKSMERWQDRYWYWLDVITTPTLADWQALPLPAALTFLYYPIRLSRLLYKYLLKVLLGSTLIRRQQKNTKEGPS